MWGGLVSNIIIVPAAISVPSLRGAAAGRAPTILQIHWVYTKIYFFSNLNFFRLYRTPLEKNIISLRILRLFWGGHSWKTTWIVPQNWFWFSCVGPLALGWMWGQLQRETFLEVGRGLFRSKWLVGVLTPKKRKKSLGHLWHLSFPSNLRLNRWSHSPGLFCQVSLKKDQRDWDWRLWSSKWRWEMKIEWHSKFNRLYIAVRASL